MLQSLHVYYITKVWYNDVFVEPHAHTYFQWIYVLKGEGDIRIGDTTYRCRPKQLLWVQRNAIHSIYGADMVTFECKFIGRDERDNSLFASLPPVLDDVEETVYALVQQMEQEIRQNAPFRDEAVKLDLSRLLLLLLRYAANSNVRKQETALRKKPVPQAPSHPLDAVVHWMEQHLSEKWTVKELAELANMEYKYFSTLFKKHYGIGPKQYSCQLRIDAVKQLLVQTELTISEIAEQAGFERIHALDRLFLQYEGMTPSQYRKHAANMYKLHLNGKPGVLIQPVFRATDRVKLNSK